ncbi:MAG: hypothetical protein ACI857_000721 [Arenicella sp.]
MTLEDDEFTEYDGDTLIKVTVGPEYSVWVMFVFIYSFLGLFFGLSKLMLGISSLWIWCFPVSFFLIIAVWMIAKLGQSTARDETLHLVSVLYHSLGEGNAERVEEQV